MTSLLRSIPEKWNIPSSLSYKPHFSRQLNCWSLRCSWSITCRRCSNYIFFLNLTPGFNGLGKDNYKMKWEAFKFWDSVRLILETLRYMANATHWWLWYKFYKLAWQMWVWNLVITQKHIPSLIIIGMFQFEWHNYKNIHKWIIQIHLEVIP